MTIRLSSDTLDRWREAARAADMTLAEWLRKMEDSEHRARRVRPPPSADPNLLAAIARAGNNLNWIARAANRNDWPDQIGLLQQLIRIERALKRMLQANDG